METVSIPICVLDKLPEEKKEQNPDKHHTYTLSNVTVQFTLCLCILRQFEFTICYNNTLDFCVAAHHFSQNLRT